MARFQFPAKPGKLLVKKRRVLAKKIDFKSERLKVSLFTGKFIQDFYNLMGDETEEDEDEDFHGFSSVEMDAAREKYSRLALQGDKIREEIWAARGVKLDRKNRDSIFNKAHQTSLGARLGPPQSKPSISSLLPAVDTQTSKKNYHPLVKTSQPRQKTSQSHQKHLLHESSKSFKNPPKLAETPVKPDRWEAEKCGGGEELAPPRPPRVQIQIPSWRPVENKFVDWRRLPGQIEDISDKVYSDRHQKAEEEEQNLWEKWQTLRSSSGLKLLGRSKSRRWREVLQPARLRSHRLSSLQSEDSFSGRLSPRTENLQEIVIATAPPTPQPEELSPGGGSKSLPYTILPEAAKDYCDVAMPLSPPLSPFEVSPKNRRKSVEPRCRSRTNTADELALSTSCPVPKYSPEAQKPITVSLAPPAPLPANHILKPINTEKRRTTAGGSRSPVIGPLGEKRSTSPKKGRQSPIREFYPLRNQSLARRTRQGSRR